MPAATLTRALVGRHGAGRSDTYDAALLDVAQDHLLWLLSELGLFSDDQLIFKGGTSLRKCRLGGLGRFSMDLDSPHRTMRRYWKCVPQSTVPGFLAFTSPSRQREVMVDTGDSG